MPEPYAFERTPYARELEVEVLRVESDAGRTLVTLDDTLLYPEGGGQPSDRGWLAGVEVIDVVREGDELHHRLASPVALGPAPLVLDWRRRYDHMQQHTAQHLLSAIAADRYGWATTSFHLGQRQCDVELATRAITKAELEQLEEAVIIEVRAALAVTARRVSPAQLSTLPVRSRGLPEGHQGDVRLVEIAGLDLNTCGGTHLRSTAEIEAIKLLGGEPLRGGMRLHWLAGARVRWRLAEHEQRHRELRCLLETSDDELAAVLGLKLEQLAAGERERRALERHLAESLAAALVERLTAGEVVVAAHLDDAGLGLLQQVGRRFAASAHCGVALLTGSADRPGCFVLAAGRDAGVDLQALGARVAEQLDGRGGGSGQIFQGRAAALDRRAAAVELLARNLIESAS